MRTLLTGLVVFLVTQPALAQSPPAAKQARREKIERKIVEALQNHVIPGCSVAVIVDSQIEWAAGYGNVALGGPAVDRNTLFQAASISKPIAACLALRLSLLGILSLDDDVNRHLKSWQVPTSGFSMGQPVTPRLILAHGSGLTVHGFRGYAPSQKLPTLRDVLDGKEPANSKPVKLIGAPGRKFRYSGGGYSVLQQLIADVTGKEFDALAREHIFDPAGMRDSSFALPLPKALADRAANGHLKTGKRLPGGHNLYPESAAAGLWTTPSDIALVIADLQRAYAGGKAKLFSRPLVETIFTRAYGDYGLGWRISGERQKLAFSHGGANEGYRCYCFGFAHSGQGAVVMTNSDSGTELVIPVIEAIAQEYDWPEIPPLSEN